MVLFFDACQPKQDHWRRAKEEIKSEDFLGAIIELNQLMEEQVPTDSNLILRAYCYTRIEKQEKAKKDLDAALRLNPSSSHAKLVYAQLLAYQGDTSAALKLLSTLDHSKGRISSECKLEKGKLFFYTHKYPEAEKSLNEAIEADSSNSKAWYYRGTFYSSFVAGYDSSGRTFYPFLNFQKALADLSTGISLNPDNAEFYYKRALVYFNTFKTTQGFTDISSAIKLDPLCKAYYLLRAEQYEKLNLTEKAKIDYNKIIKLDPLDSLAIRKH